MYRLCGITLTSLFWFSNAYAIYRFMQIAVWQRVMEINEAVVMRTLTVSVYFTSVCYAFATMPGFRFTSMSSVLKQGGPVQVSVSTCYGVDHPFTQG